MADQYKVKLSKSSQYTYIFTALPAFVIISVTIPKRKKDHNAVLKVSWHALDGAKFTRG